MYIFYGRTTSIKSVLERYWQYTEHFTKLFMKRKDIIFIIPLVNCIADLTLLELWWIPNGLEDFKLKNGTHVKSLCHCIALLPQRTADIHSLRIYPCFFWFDIRKIFGRSRLPSQYEIVMSFSQKLDVSHILIALMKKKSRGKAVMRFSLWLETSKCVNTGGLSRTKFWGAFTIFTHFIHF